MNSVLRPVFDSINKVKDRTFWKIAFFILLSGLSGVVLLKPAPFWGMVPYMGCVISYDQNDPQFIHETTYNEFEKHATSLMKEKILLRPDAFCRDMQTNSDHFTQQFVFYKIKFLYVFISYIFFKCGIPLYYAVLVPMSLSLFFTGLILFQWLKRYYSLLFSAVFILLLLTASFNIQTFRIASPDAMAGTFMLASVFSLIERRSYFLFSMFLILTVLTRPDAIFFELVLSFLLACFYFKSAKERITLTIILMALTGIIYFLKDVTGYDPITTFYCSFIHMVTDPATLKIDLTFQMYSYGVKDGLIRSLSMPRLYVFIGLILLCMVRRTQLEKVNWLVSLAIALAFIVRMFFHPLFEDRYLFMSMDILIVLLLISFVNKGQTT